MSAPRFTPRAALYDALVDWPRRLAREAPFFRALFERHAVARVLDAACGTGRHAALFAEWGCTVEGADVNPEMLRLAAERTGTTSGLHWVTRSFADPVLPAGQFDAVVCTGNSLALAPCAEDVQRAVRALVSATGPGGIIVLHVLNLFRLPDGPLQWQIGRTVTVDGTPHTLVKGVHRAGASGYVDFAAVPACDSTEPPVFESVPFLGLEAAVLRTYLEEAGVRAVRCYGSYEQEPYTRERSVDLIVVAEH